MTVEAYGENNIAIIKNGTTYVIGEKTITVVGKNTVDNLKFTPVVNSNN